MDIQKDDDYINVIIEIKNKVKAAQLKAATAVNAELVLLYWEIGQKILEKQSQRGWGSKVIDTLSKDLIKSFPNMKGFSPRNLKYMRAFAEEYEKEIVQELLAQITWYHNITALEKVKSRQERIWYLKKVLKHGWSRNVLVHHIESKLFNRQANLDTKSENFSTTLPAPQSDFAQEMLKDPYNFDFLTISNDAYEKEIENALVSHITQFLLELGTGFSFVGQQVHIELSGKDYYIDLLFYHLKLRCYVVIELKSRDFKPEYAGKLNFYLTLVDEQLKHKDDAPTIGLLLCKEKDRLTAEYALKDIHKPIGVSEYQLVESLPEDLKPSLPSIDKIEEELSR